MSSSNVRSLNGYERALEDAPDTHQVVTVYRRRQIELDNGKKVWRQHVIGRKVLDEHGRILWQDAQTL